MKPRIVRDNPGYTWLHEANEGTPYLALPWPTECPYGPEAVMAACERAGESPIGVPVQYGNAWFVPYDFGCWTRLTPEFMGEPKRCEHRALTGGIALFIKCPDCGAILSDRRKGERRKGERRVLTCRDRRMGFTTRPGSEDRRTHDRRQSHD